MKNPLLIVGVFLTLAATSQAGPGGGFGGRGFHGGFGGHGMGFSHGGGFGGRGFHGGFGGHGMGFSHGGRFSGGGFRGRSFANRQFFDHDRLIFFQQFVWPFYSYPYYDPLAYSYLGPDSDYQYWDNSATSGQSQSYGGAADRSSVVIVINNTGGSRPADSSSNPGYADIRGYLPISAAGQQRTVVQDPPEKTESRTDPITPVTPAVPPAIPIPAPNTQTSLQTQGGVFTKLVLVSWLEDGGKDVVFVKNIDTNDVQRITSQPNIDHFRLVELHPNADPRQFEAIIANGSEQGAVRFSLMP